MGVPVQKIPTDLWLYQEILYKDRPDIIIECGTAFGGSALYMAGILDLLGSGAVITVDIDDWDLDIPGYSGRKAHPRITYLKGSSVDPAMVEQVKARIPDGAVVMAILDSDHSAEHVLAELRTYAPMVTPGQLLIVEDTMLNGHPVHQDFGPGPMEALDTFLSETDDFTIDAIGEKFLVSFNPRGYLRRA
jgi:cephalosporin hydroxylase